MNYNYIEMYAQHIVDDIIKIDYAKTANNIMNIRVHNKTLAKTLCRYSRLARDNAFCTFQCNDCITYRNIYYRERDNAPSYDRICGLYPYITKTMLSNAENVEIDNLDILPILVISKLSGVPLHKIIVLQGNKGFDQHGKIICLNDNSQIDNCTLENHNLEQYEDCNDMMNNYTFNISVENTQNAISELSQHNDNLRKKLCKTMHILDGIQNKTSDISYVKKYKINKCSFNCGMCQDNIYKRYLANYPMTNINYKICFTIRTKLRVDPNRGLEASNAEYILQIAHLAGVSIYDIIKLTSSFEFDNYGNIIKSNQ